MERVTSVVLGTKHSPTALKLQKKQKQKTKNKKHFVPVSDKSKVIPNKRNGAVCPAMRYWILSIDKKVTENHKICHKQSCIGMLEIISAILLLDAHFVFDLISMLQEKQILNS